MTDQEMRHFVRQAEPFVRGADVGATKRVIAEDGSTLGDCEIVCEHGGDTVLMVAGFPARPLDDVKRFRKKLSDAYKQFVPGAPNIIFMTACWPDDIEDFEVALFGPVFEDHGRVPVTRTRVSSGFWSKEKHLESCAAVWFYFEPRSDLIWSKVWIRDGATLDTPTRDLLRRLFERG
jgi:hypothetical protein